MNRLGMIDMPPAGFSGLNPHEPVTLYRRHLPHWRQDDATYFVTFRLADSLPKSKLEQLKSDREAWLQRHPDPTDADWQEFCRRFFDRIERYLDGGHGACVLRNETAARIVDDALHHFQDKRYLLSCACVMPNHVHVILRPFSKFSLESILQSWKRHTARQINKLLSRGGTLWQEESFDRIVRDCAHLRGIISYIQRNPRQVGLTRGAWVTPKWSTWLDGEQQE